MFIFLSFARINMKRNEMKYNYKIMCEYCFSRGMQIYRLKQTGYNFVFVHWELRSHFRIKAWSAWGPDNAKKKKEINQQMIHAECEWDRINRIVIRISVLQYFFLRLFSVPKYINEYIWIPALGINGMKERICHSGYGIFHSNHFTFHISPWFECLFLNK